MVMSGSRVGEDPPTFETILDAAGENGLMVYDMVRDIVDKLNDAAPWQLLYYPPEDEHAFFEMAYQFLIEIDGIRDRIGATMETLLNPKDSSAIPVRQIRVFFDNLIGMICQDQHVLAKKLAEFARQSISVDERNVICELGADLKGKVQNSLMGVAARVLGHSHWSGPEVEPVLFPEKLDEGRRNRQLVRALQEVIRLIRGLQEEMSFPDLITTWIDRRRVDQYALVDLFILQGAVGQLMKVKNRRALYSGDYHRIRERDGRLCDRISEINLRHNRTWSTDPREGNETDYSHLVEKTLEIALSQVRQPRQPVL